MKQSNQIKKSVDISPVRWIFGGLAAVTLYFQTNLADPFNSPKLWVVLIVAAWLTGYIVSYKNLIHLIKPISTLFYLVITFLSFALLSVIFAYSHKTAIFGETQRRNGFISYLSLSIIIIAASLFVRSFNIKRLFVATYFIGTISVTYALFQTTNNDFIKWNNGYNAIITTLGNPNFASAVMAVMAVITFSSIFIKEFKIYFRIYATLLTLLLLFAIYRSNARQGLLSFILGTGLFLIIWLFDRNKKLAVTASLVGLFVVAISILGMLQIGPIEKYLYKPSVTLRGYYWQTGITMLKHHPLFGVGLDNYGYFFKQYRDVTYPLNYGFNLTSTNAHNTFIQFFATGGIFLGAAYLILNGYILKRAIFSLKNLTGDNKLILAGVLSAWIAFHAQSLVSIDNLGISIWGWVLGGSIIGVSVSAITPVGEEKKYFQVKQNSMNLIRSLISGIALLLGIILVSLLYRGENNAFKIMQSYDLNVESNKNIYRELNLKTINSTFIDSTYSLNAAMNLIQIGFIDDGLKVAKKIHIENPKDLNTLDVLALTYEQTGKISEAVSYREEISKLDPWNAENYLALGKDYRAQGDLIKSKKMLDKILSFASGKQVAEQARIDLA